MVLSEVEAGAALGSGSTWWTWTTWTSALCCFIFFVDEAIGNLLCQRGGAWKGLVVMKSNDNKFGETPLKFNSSPLKKGWLEDYFPIGKVTFQGLC